MVRLWQVGFWTKDVGSCASIWDDTCLRGCKLIHQVPYNPPVAHPWLRLTAPA